jgi:hypothetical protein
MRARATRAAGAPALEVLEGRVVLSLTPTTTVVSASPSAPTFGTEVTLTATVTPTSGTTTPTGLVEFLNGTTDLGTGNLNASGIATLKTPALPVGVDSITAKYEGDTTFDTSTSNPITVDVAKAPTTTALQANPTTAVFGQPVSLTATVASTTTGIGTPTGNVEFLNGSTEIQTTAVNGSGVATISTSSLPVGSDSITAIYQSDDNFATSTSTASTVTITAIPTTATLAVSPTNPALGQSVTLKATVAPQSPFTGTPTGTVSFLDNGTALGTGTLAGGVATLATTALTGGANVLSVSYASDGTFASTTSQATTVTIGQASSVTTLSVSPNPSFPGQKATLTATVMGVNSGAVIPTGTVIFFAGATSLGSASLTSGGATLSTALPLGTSQITAAYQGDVSFTPSISPAVAAVATAAQTSVTITPTIANPGPTQTEVFNVTVATTGTGATPTGTVAIYANGVLVGGATLSAGSTSGTATGKATIKDLPLGNAVIIAAYPGDGINAASASTPLTLPVGAGVEQYLNGVYLQSLGRSADVGTILTINNGGLAAWLSKYVENNGFRRPVVSHVVHSKEGRQYSVHATYQNVAGKDSTQAQQQNALSDSHGTTVNLYSRVFGGPAYYQNVGASTEAFLDALGTDLLGTALPASFTAKFTAELNRGTPRSTIVHQLLQSITGKNAQVNGLYQQVLNRAADAIGLRFNVTGLNQGKSNDYVLINLLSSPEYFNKFTSTSTTSTT